jgi:FkbM family methyltransferase
MIDGPFHRSFRRVDLFLILRKKIMLRSVKKLWHRFSKNPAIKAENPRMDLTDPLMTLENPLLDLTQPSIPLEAPAIDFADPSMNWHGSPIRLNVGLEALGFEGVSLFTHGYKDIISECIIKYQIWEAVETKFFLENIKPGNTVLDLGANIGYYTCLAARLVGPKGQVFAFEPNDSNFALLSKNISHNQFQNVFPMKAIVADKCGFAKLNENTAGNMGAHMAVPIDYHEFTQCSYHPKITLDDFEDLDLGQIDFLKIDTQGSEPLIIKGAKKLIEKNRHHLKIVMEFSPVWMCDIDVNAADFIDDLKFLGFEIFFIDPIKMEIQKLTDPEWLIHTLWFPNGVDWPEKMTFADLILLPNSQ